MSSKRTRILCLLLLALLFGAGCGESITFLTPGPTHALSYLQRAREFTALALLAFADSRMVWGQGVRAVYYAALTLARMKDFDGIIHDGTEFHARVWNQVAKRGGRRFFRDTLRPMRNLYDYQLLRPVDETVEDDLRTLAIEGPIAFSALTEDVRDAVERQFRRCPNEVEACDFCRRREPALCLRGEVLAELADVHRQIQGILTDTIPPLLH